MTEDETQRTHRATAVWLLDQCELDAAAVPDRIAAALVHAVLDLAAAIRDKR